MKPDRQAALHPSDRPRRRGRSGPAFEVWLWWSAIAVAAPAVAAFSALLIRPALAEHALALLVLVALLMGALASRLRRRVAYPLNTLSNLLEAMREGDFSLRGSRTQRGDALGDLVHEVNELAETLRQQRLQVTETLNLLGKVMSEIDIAVLTFDQARRLRLVNAAGARLLAASASSLLGQSADAIGLGDCLDHDADQLRQRQFPGGSGRYEIRHQHFRKDGVNHDLLVISDLSRRLREEEQQAWQRLIRVLGHELNNSLAAIRSMAETVESLLTREQPPPDWREDSSAGLRLIRDRADALRRFLLGYAALARLPRPQRREVALEELIAGVARLETRVSVRVRPGPALSIMVDPDQIEQALINLLHNAAEASLQTVGAPSLVEIDWQRQRDRLRIRISDQGPGPPVSENLFVPFFTTKPGGSGIGLVLARQIAEAHGGSIALCARADRPGCEARLFLPLPDDGGVTESGAGKRELRE